MIFMCARVKIIVSFHWRAQMLTCIQLGPPIVGLILCLPWLSKNRIYYNVFFSYPRLRDAFDWYPTDDGLRHVDYWLPPSLSTSIFTVYFKIRKDEKYSSRFSAKITWGCKSLHAQRKDRVAGDPMDGLRRSELGSRGKTVNLVHGPIASPIHPIGARRT